MSLHALVHAIELTVGMVPSLLFLEIQLLSAPSTSFFVPLCSQNHVTIYIPCPTFNYGDRCMSLGNDVGKFMWAIAEQKEGFSFGKAWKNSSNALGLVIPILRNKEVHRNYKMLEESKKVTITDTGSIDSAHVKSKDDSNVFIRSGIILVGPTQERVTLNGVVVLSNSEQDIEVKCVHASKGIQRGAIYDLNKTEVAPASIHLAFAESDRNEKQGRVWNSVQQYSARMKTSNLGNFGRVYGAHRNTVGYASLAEDDDLVGTLKEIEKSKQTVEGSLKDIPLMENQVGCIIFDRVGITGFEVFDSPKSWAAMHQKVLSKYSDVLMQEQEESIFELKEDVIPKKISAFVEDIMTADEKQSHATKSSITYVIDGEKCIGEYTMINEAVIHVLAFKREMPKSKAKEMERNRSRPISDHIFRTADVGDSDSYTERHIRRSPHFRVSDFRMGF